jgi:hypothetical protein
MLDYLNNAACCNRFGSVNVEMPMDAWDAPYIGQIPELTEQGEQNGDGWATMAPTPCISHFQMVALATSISHFQ